MIADLPAYGALFASAFVAATLFPASSEALLVGLLVAGTGEPWWLVAVATLGNTLGGVFNWVCGRFLAAQSDRRWFPVSPGQIERAGRWFARFGQVSLLFTWLPVVGDALTVAAGALQVPLGRFVLLVGIGKGLRYVALASATLAGLGAR
ncbi:YqaA family protein [Aureimonas sp. AU4]|uniref:YqaA family protein n=1 Tax=Aureimonas sp. AU4 TaxID=1638163 RepID=UPI0007811D6F|nr:YqaA family protein [Aureimonas sp. AU4]